MLGFIFLTDGVMHFHKDRTLPSSLEDILVFGSNLRGRHGKGAALLAVQRFGAREGKCFGLFGRSFAVPTKDEHIRSLPLERVAGFVDQFVKFANDNRDMRFFVTRFGCELAGNPDSAIAGLVLAAAGRIGFDLGNCSFAEEWRQYLVSEQVPSVYDDASSGPR